MRSRSTTAQRYAACACMGLALAQPPAAMGCASCLSNTSSAPRRPGKTKSKSDHSSRRLFWIGAPVRIRRCAVRSCLAATVTAASGLRMRCPSSRMAYDHRNGSSAAACRRTASYVVTSAPPQSWILRMTRLRLMPRAPMAWPLSCSSMTRMSGTQACSSRTQCDSMVAGATMSVARSSRECRSADSSAATSIVLPSPISSPTMPPASCWCSSHSHRSAVRW
mmetsp:Transcript_4142/g.15316  ORF Transcript_4142/g.15316 Transcript_4142/m.15316 type:complete len:222 (-) Transcript_4142:253-918(-)